MKVSDPAGTPPPDDIAGSISHSISELSSNASTAGDLLAGIATDVSRLVRLEIELAKQEFVELAKPKALAAGLGLLGVVLALCIVPFILLTVFEVFSLWMPQWVAALLMTILVAAACAGVFFFANKKLEGEFVPRRTIASLKESLAWAKRLKK